MNDNHKIKSIKPIVIFGAGGHASVLLEILILCDRNVIGIVDPMIKEAEGFESVPFITYEEFLKDYSPEDVEVVNGIGFMPGSSSREDLANKLRESRYKFVSLIHPSAIIARNVEIGEGAQIMANSVLQPNVKIGSDTIINTSCSVDHHSVIGKKCHIAPGVVLSGGVNIADSSFIGAGSIIINDLNIGKNVIVAAGSIIYKDLPDYTKLIQKK